MLKGLQADVDTLNMCAQLSMHTHTSTYKFEIHEQARAQDTCAGLCVSHICLSQSLNGPYKSCWIYKMKKDH